MSDLRVCDREYFSCAAEFIDHREPTVEELTAAILALDESAVEVGYWRLGPDGEREAFKTGGLDPNEKYEKVMRVVGPWVVSDE